MKSIFNADSRTFTITAFIIGFILIDDFTALEQNALGNWLIMVGQVLETSSAQQQLIDFQHNKNQTNKNSNKTNIPLNISVQNLSKKELILIKSVIDKMQNEIDNLINNTD